MVSSRLANRIGVAGARRPMAGAQRPVGGVRRPVTDAREVLNARAVRAARPNPALASARRLGLASRGIVKTGRAPNLRLTTMRNDLAGTGGGGLRSDRITAAAASRGFVTTQLSPRFQGRSPRQLQVQGYGGSPLMQQRRMGVGGGLISSSKRLAELRQMQAAQMDIDERSRPGLLRGRGAIEVEEEEDDDDDLERLTLDDVLGRPSAAGPARLYQSAASGLRSSPRSSPRTPTSLSRIQHRLDGGGLGTSAGRRSPSDPLQGVSVLVANLHPQVTEGDIRDLFQDIGPMHDARMVAVGTALATFQRQADAMKAYKAYNGRLLDGQPMNLTVLTLGMLQSNQR
ncbi:uncharacterized protein LOC144138884 isoform X3 [Haemaphysalis longicornis]